MGRRGFARRFDSLTRVVRLPANRAFRSARFNDAAALSRSAGKVGNKRDQVETPHRRCALQYRTIDCRSSRPVYGEWVCDSSRGARGWKRDRSRLDRQSAHSRACFGGTLVSNHAGSRFAVARNSLLAFHGTRCICRCGQISRSVDRAYQGHAGESWSCGGWSVARRSKAGAVDSIVPTLFRKERERWGTRLIFSAGCAWRRSWKHAGSRAR